MLLGTTLQRTYLDQVFDFYILYSIKKPLAGYFCIHPGLRQETQLFGTLSASRYGRSLLFCQHVLAHEDHSVVPAVADFEEEVAFVAPIGPTSAVPVVVSVK
eukprot:TRINITY_DN10492_c0_g2_i1.p2 TRINITY_DN10492_c0_g2~~TRINITY_DN10492_c0_g2_i1.p2  ORF type:complete len:102 (+),score=7.27 TRINITY_DN10492_c0_g2_i1:332-637(+)